MKESETEKNVRAQKVEEENDVRNKRKTKITRKTTEWCGVVRTYCDLGR
jgi:hypothetical protein